MAFSGRERLPARSPLSRFLASLTPPAVEALRTLFLDDALARPLGREQECGGLMDRAGSQRVVFDIDGTREAARQPALPKTPELPTPKLRLDELCPPGYPPRKRRQRLPPPTPIPPPHPPHRTAPFSTPR